MIDNRQGCNIEVGVFTKGSVNGRYIYKTQFIN